MALAGQDFDAAVKAAIDAANELGGMEGAAARGEIKEPSPAGYEQYFFKAVVAPVASFEK